MFLTTGIVLTILSTSALAAKDNAVSPRKPRLFFVSSSSTTSTFKTATMCYTTSATLTACGRKKRSILEAANLSSEMNPSSVSRMDDSEEESLMDVDSLDSGVDEEADRKAKFLLYWKTTTFTSTTTSYTATVTLASLECTPTGFSINACSGKKK